MAMGAATLRRRQGRDRRSPDLPHRQLHAAGGRPRGRDFRSVQTGTEGIDLVIGTVR
ncbi:MAG: hypothetical protein ACLUNV_08800 [Sutterella wadsworthensis]